MCVYAFVFKKMERPNSVTEKEREREREGGEGLARQTQRASVLLLNCLGKSKCLADAESGGGGGGKEEKEGR